VAKRRRQPLQIFRRDKMKNIIFVAGLILCLPAVADQPKETKRVCVDVKDKDGKEVKDKNGKVKQNCKEIKQHKKLDGEKVPEKK
jgi:hypothetical protein